MRRQIATGAVVLLLLTACSSVKGDADGSGVSVTPTAEAPDIGEPTTTAPASDATPPHETGESVVTTTTVTTTTTTTATAVVVIPDLADQLAELDELDALLDELDALLADI
jgi:hypothetical protein